MKLEDFLQAFYDFSGKASEITRQLGLAGLAAIWIFKSEDVNHPNVPNNLHIPNDLIKPGLLIILGLACDLLQYVSGSIIWSIFHSTKERKGVPSDQEVSAPSWLNKPIYFFFYTKIILVGSGYVFLLRYLFSILI